MAGVTRRLWRIGKAEHANTHWSGIGGLHVAGRWTWQGRRVVYCASTESLAALEILAQIRNIRYLPDCVIASAAIPADLEINRIDAHTLPPGWDDPESPPEVVRDLGTTWLYEGSAAVLQVPSVHATTETNYLLNPEHPDFQRIDFGKPTPYRFDRRLHQ